MDRRRQLGDEVAPMKVCGELRWPKPPATPLGRCQMARAISAILSVRWRRGRTSVPCALLAERIEGLVSKGTCQLGIGMRGGLDKQTVVVVGTGPLSLGQLVRMGPARPA